MLSPNLKTRLVLVLIVVSIGIHLVIVQQYNKSTAELWSPVPFGRRNVIQVFDAEIGSPSPFKGNASEQLDRRWNDLVDRPMLLIDESQMHLIGESTTNAASRQGKFYAMVEVFHQLHCLNLVRKYVRREQYPNESAFQGTIEEALEHVDHCIDILRQVLMCQADTGLITFTDRGHYASPMPRFSTKHLCRDFSALVDWIEASDYL